MSLLLTVICLAYLMGSLSSAVLVAKVMGLPDPRQHGSYNAGATNMLRIGGKLPASLTLFGDVLKGFLPVILSQNLGFTGMLLMLVLLAAILGHLYPLYFQFKGGKGVATLLGGLFGLSFYLGIGFIGIWLVLLILFRISSLSALLATAALPVLGHFYLATNKANFVLSLIAVIIVMKHRSNIIRLIKGVEPKVGSKS